MGLHRQMDWDGGALGLGHWHPPPIRTIRRDMAFPFRFSPREAWADLRDYFATRERYHWVFMGLALLITTIFIVEFIFWETPIIYRPPPVVFVKQWPKSRTDAEIKAQQAKDAPAERAQRKAEADYEAERQRQFKALQKALHL